MNRRVLGGLAAGSLLGGALAVAFKPSFYPPYDESVGYVNIAKGIGRWVPSYYAGRVLHPLFVRLLAIVFRVPIDARLFVWASAIALTVFFACLGVSYATESFSTPRLWLLLAATAAIVDPYRNYYWHDLFYAALCALFFLALRANWWLSLPFVFLLYITRESTIVLVVALVTLAALRRRWAFCFSALAAGLAGLLVEGSLVRRAVPNNHGIPMAFVDVLKIPYNFALNIFGLEFWANTNAATTPPPHWIAKLPAWLPLGNIHEMGFSGFLWDQPLRTLLVLSTAFGVLPLIVIRAARRGWGRLLFGRFELALACVYGALMFVLTPLQGTTPARYVLYAWPLFWLFGVAGLEGVIPERGRRIAIVALSVCAAWTPAIVRLAMTRSIPQGPESFSDVSNTGLLISLALVGAIYAFAWRITGSGALEIEDAGLEGPGATSKP